MLRRLRTVTLWTGTLLCVLIVAAFVVSGWWWIVFQVPTSCGPTMYLGAGSATVVADRTTWVPLVVKPSMAALRNWNNWAAGPRHVQFPLYALLAAVAVPTVLVWRFWRKPAKPRHCRCGYDLQGNESGRCPECGIEVQM